MGHVFLVLFAKVVVPLFFLGLAGSALVVLVTTFRDLSEVWTSDDEGVSDL
jgi:ABC-type polysaccharide/polyol phosphate export permease